MNAVDDLLHRGDDLRGSGAAADVVHPLEEHHVRRACAFQHVAVEPLQQRRAVAAPRNDAVAGDPRVHDGSWFVGALCRQARREHIDPSLILAVNGWIRTQAGFDSVIDFDQLMSGGPVDGESQSLKPEFSCDDDVHPNPAGYRAMGQFVDLALFGASKRTPSVREK